MDIIQVEQHALRCQDFVMAIMFKLAIALLANMDLI
jgi:hypothetical protein